MITRRLFQTSSTLLKRMNIFKMVPSKSFVSVNGLLDIVKQEIDHEEKNYEPVSAEDKNTFLTNSGFKFEEVQNTTKMILSKKTKEYEVSVIFFAR